MDKKRKGATRRNQSPAEHGSPGDRVHRGRHDGVHAKLHESAFAYTLEHSPHDRARHVLAERALLLARRIRELAAEADAIRQLAGDGQAAQVADGSQVGSTDWGGLAQGGASSLLESAAWNLESSASTAGVWDPSGPRWGAESDDEAAERWFLNRVALENGQPWVPGATAQVRADTREAPRDDSTEGRRQSHHRRRRQARPKKQPRSRNQSSE